MKKTLKKIVIIIILFLFFQWIITCFIKEHTLDYKVTVNKKTYGISEEFEIVDKQHIYTLEIEDDKKQQYHFQFFIDYNKQKHIVEDIILLKKDQISCLYPVLKDKEQSYLICHDQEGEFSYEVLKQKHESIAKDFVHQLKKKNITLDQDKAISKKYEDIIYYPDNFEDMKLALWNYRQLYYLTKEKKSTISLFENDQYENQYSIQVDDDYLIIDTDQEHEFDQIYMINLKKGTKKVWKIKKKISLDSYFLGTVEGKAYLFDRDNLIEYCLDPKDKTIEIIGNIDKNGKYYNGSWHEKNIYEFKNEKLFFPRTISVEAIEDMYPSAKIYEEKKAYYFVDNHNLYVSYKNSKKSPIQLLTNVDIKEIQIKDNKINFIDGDTIYRYTSGYALKKIVTSREMKFNYENIYTIYDK